MHKFLVKNMSSFLAKNLTFLFWIFLAKTRSFYYLLKEGNYIKSRFMDSDFYGCFKGALNQGIQNTLGRTLFCFSNSKQTICYWSWVR
jgi:hypothetical protein